MKHTPTSTLQQATPLEYILPTVRMQPPLLRTAVALRTTTAAAAPAATATTAASRLSAEVHQRQPSGHDRGPTTTAATTIATQQRMHRRRHRAAPQPGDQHLPVTTAVDTLSLRNPRPATLIVSTGDAAPRSTSRGRGEMAGSGGGGGGERRRLGRKKVPREGLQEG